MVLSLLKYSFLKPAPLLKIHLAPVDFFDTPNGSRSSLQDFPAIRMYEQKNLPYAWEFLHQLCLRFQKRTSSLVVFEELSIQ